MGEEQPANDAQQPRPERARIYFNPLPNSDPRAVPYLDVAVHPGPNGWLLLVANILQNRGFLFDQMWIPERTIRLIVRNPGAEPGDPNVVGSNVVPLRPIG